MPVDTLAVVRKLEAAGTPRQQAEALAEVLREAEVQSWAELATKADLALLRQEMAALRAEMAALEERVDAKLASFEQRFDAKLVSFEQRFDAKLASLEQRMTIRLGAMLAVAVGVVATLVRLL